jgi:hypothetical protein
MVMRHAVASITLLFVSFGCDGRTDAARLGEVEQLSAASSDEAVDAMLTFDAGLLARSEPMGSAPAPQGPDVPDDALAQPVSTPGIPLHDGARSGECTGLVVACEDRSIAECVRGEGCLRERSCVGTRPECDSPSMDADTCARAGCTWAEHCEGEATPCSYMNEDECLKQPGCAFAAP